MYESSLSAKWNLTTGELKVWRHAAAYTEANSYFPHFFFLFPLTIIICYYSLFTLWQHLKPKSGSGQLLCKTLAVRKLELLENILKEHADPLSLTASEEEL